MCYYILQLYVPYTNKQCAITFYNYMSLTLTNISHKLESGKPMSFHIQPPVAVA